MIFLLGTDTNCGKTTVGRALAARCRSLGRTVGVFKPVETGCAARDGQRWPADARALAEAAGCHLSLDLICPYRLILPASPQRAARGEGITLQTEVIQSAWHSLRQKTEWVVAEGAGGALVPLTDTTFVIDLPALLDLPVLIVARDALGTVNHTLLTVEAVRRRNLTLLGVVLSATPDTQPALENAAAIERHGQVPVLGVLPYLPNADDGALAAAAQSALDPQICS